MHGIPPRSFFDDRVCVLLVLFIFARCPGSEEVVEWLEKKPTPLFLRHWDC
jgi:hypothetical protein